MTASRTHRRTFLKSALAAGMTAAFPMPALPADAAARVVVVGGGFAGASCARALKTIDPRLAVTLIETERAYTALPGCNGVLAGLRGLPQQQFIYEGIAKADVEVVNERATAIDPQTRRVTLNGGNTVAYDRLVLAPGIGMRWDAIAGYDRAAADIMPHAWKDALQIGLLRRQLDAMDDGGTVVISVPVNPSRCPPAPYERASLIAHFLKTKRPRAKLIVLDSKDNFSMQRLFASAWKELYPDLLEWVPLSSGGKIVSVDVASRTIATDFEIYRADVANVIPPQKAGDIAVLAGVADRTGWCPIDPVTFESKLQPDIHVIGDAAIAGAIPKSAAAANSAGKLCAANLVKLLAGQPPDEPELVSTCYSLLAPAYAISLTGKYRPAGGQFIEVEGAGNTSPLDAPLARRSEEAKLADGWFKDVTKEVFG